MHISAVRIRGLWRRITSTAYARALEADLVRVRADNSRLRDENRALLNSILGIAGVPPVYSNSAEDPRSVPSPRTGPEAPAFGTGLASTEQRAPAMASQIETGTDRTKKTTQLAAPVRRRSWHQINRALEFQSVRRCAQENPQDG